MLGIIARGVFAMSGELDGEARQRRTMMPGQVADHQRARLELSIGDAGEHVGVEIAGEDGGGHDCELGAGNGELGFTKWEIGNGKLGNGDCGSSSIVGRNLFHAAGRA